MSAGKTRMKTSSVKNKGRTFQKEIAADIRKLFSEQLHEDDVGWCSMGSSGVDIELSPLAQTLVPFDIECKNVEKPNLWEVLRQAWDRDLPKDRPERIPLAALRKNRTKPVVVVPLGWIYDLLKEPDADPMGPRATLAQMCPLEKRCHTASVTIWLQRATNAERSQQHAEVFTWLGYRWRTHSDKNFPFWKTVNAELGGEYATDGIIFNRNDENHVLMAVVSWELLKKWMTQRTQKPCDL
jgi:hypothetical protein